MGGRFFDTEKPTQLSTLGKPQEALLSQLIKQIGGSYNQANPDLDELMRKLMSDTSGESKDMSERMFREALLNPAMDAYNRDVAPKIAGDYAAIGGTLSSRRDQTLNQGRTDVIRGAQSSLAGILPQVYGFPLQQTLNQIQGFGAINAQRRLPLQDALTLALTNTQNPTKTAPGPGWEITSELAKAVGMAAIACWVAERLYGYGSMRYLLARWWIMVQWQGPVAEACRWVYQRFGRHVARSRLACWCLKPLFDRAVRCGAKNWRTL